jgi:hypothetical protein
MIVQSSRVKEYVVVLGLIHRKALRAAALAVALNILPGAAAAETGSDFQGATHLTPFDEEAINYSKTAEAGPVARLREQIEKGQATLAYDPDQGYLPAVLKALGISPASQMLVFSKTSLQRERISPRTPRAIFFNDDAYVGFIPGAPLLEISAVDPKLGAIFYQIEQKPSEKPKLVRTDACLECHASAKSMGVPGHLVRSFAVDDDGAPDLNDGTSLVNHRTPIAERWGGWYVTGRGDGEVHRGNLFGKEAFAKHEKEPAHLGTLTNLSGLFATNRYPAAATSDIAALLVLEHQAHMHNFLTRLNYESTMALQSYGHINYLRTIITSFLKYLLFVDEAPLAGSVHPGTIFAAHFEKLGPDDRRGRSLRQFDLQTRLFKYPCSFLLYSDAFDHLPAPTKEVVYRRLWEVLQGQDKDPAFAKLSPETRRAIQEILVETKPDLPTYWRTPEAGASRGNSGTATPPENPAPAPRR